MRPAPPPISPNAPGGRALAAPTIPAETRERLHPFKAGSVRAELNFQYLVMSQMVHGDRYVSFSELKRANPEAAEHGDASFYVVRANLIDRIALTDWTEFTFIIPYHRLSVRTANEDEHHRNETLAGLADIRLKFRHVFVARESIQFAATIGVSLPTGKLNPVTAASYMGHDQANAIGATLDKHSHLQLGTGTWDPFTGADVRYRFSDYGSLFGAASANLPLYANRFGYRTSPNFTFVAGASADAPEEVEEPVGSATS